ncbi:unnamed protein product [Fusarium equiseti]|uniref:Uncharacterized protein n=1 Tax=Fusarium equiseti TaxID=61235 RepID=A0A8J2IG35_FUSEQ|nr:unnamed protein product [Fusarium equiseti]
MRLNTALLSIFATTSAAITIPGTFSLEAPAGTDIWRKPPTTDVWNVPITRTSSGLLSKFQSANVTFWADWTERYDQAGLVLGLRRASVPTKPEDPAQKWVKTGVEYYLGKPQLSTVGCDIWADWSVTAISDTVDPAKGVTLMVVRESDENGKSAWVYRLIKDDDGNVKEKIPLREICWIFADEHENRGEEWILDISPLVARPASNATSPLKVDFMDFSVNFST